MAERLSKPLSQVLREAVADYAEYVRVPRARGREIDLAIAACAIARGASIWTLNRAAFDDIPDLSLYQPPSA